MRRQTAKWRINRQVAVAVQEVTGLSRPPTSSQDGQDLILPPTLNPVRAAGSQLTWNLKVGPRSKLTIVVYQSRSFILCHSTELSTKNSTEQLVKTGQTRSTLPRPTPRSKQPPTARPRVTTSSSALTFQPGSRIVSVGRSDSAREVGLVMTPDSIPRLDFPRNDGAVCLPAANARPRDQIGRDITVSQPTANAPAAPGVTGLSFCFPVIGNGESLQHESGAFVEVTLKNAKAFASFTQLVHRMKVETCRVR
ncbi:hypothetical protein J6590_075177 [Homalodisca vitripennis]|nr:hypothetical protein J6590_075177 [Homalodisca vitripennis]